MERPVNDLVYVRVWLLFALFLVGFLFGYFGDIFLGKEK